MRKNYNDEIIKIDTGCISGTTLGEPGNEVRVYRGIPYAAPPLDDLRWKLPQPVTPWSGIRECTDFSLWPAQVRGPWPVQPMSEDCLYLNVLTPAKSASERLPVMVWIHGGEYSMLSGTQPTYNYPYLPQHGVVVVSVSTRLGVLGLLAHPLLSRESENGLSGNYLFFDLIASLQWVQKNITAFGGDPDNVTIFGNSGGAAKCNVLMASPLAKGLFHRVIHQSGYGTGTPLKDLEMVGEQLFEKLGVDRGKDPLTAARALPWSKIIEADAALAKEKDLTQVWDAAVDGCFLTDTVTNIFKAGKQHKLPFIVGSTLGELVGWKGFLSTLISGYMDLLSGAAKAGVKAYAYAFDQLPSKWKQEGCATAHATEVIYVFGCWGIQSEWDWFYEFSYVPAGAKQPDPGITETDRKVSEATMAMWVQFAKTGDPNVKDLISWPEYKLDADQYLYIAEPLKIKTGFSKLQD